MLVDITPYERQCEHYQDPNYALFGDGVFPKDPSGNGILYLGHFVLIGRHVGVPEERLNSLSLTHYFKVLVRNGLINRKPLSLDPQYHDDYTGLVYTRRDLALAVLDHGRSSNWNYNNLAPQANSVFDIVKQGARFWHRRMPGQIEHYKICAGESLDVLEKILWMASIVSTALWGKGASGMLLDLLKLKAAESPKSLSYRIAKYFFQRRLNKEYGGKVQNPYRAYFGELHPFTVYAKGLEL